MSIPDWESESDLWDRPVIDGTVVPGIWTVQATATKNLDIKVKRGRDGATVRDRGTEPVALSFEGQIISSGGEWDAFVQFSKRILPRRGDPRGSHTIVHPVAQLYGVNAIEIQEVTGPEITRGVGRVSFRAIEWLPKSKKKRKRPNLTGDVWIAPENWQRAPSAFASSQPPSTDDFSGLAGF